MSEFRTDQMISIYTGWGLLHCSLCVHDLTLLSFDNTYSYVISLCYVKETQVNKSQITENSQLKAEHTIRI